MIERDNIIKDYISKICQWLYKSYSNKKCIVFGYNIGWKSKVNMGKNMNRIFYGIPFRKIMDGIKEYMNKRGIEVKETEESYTSKCDGLAKEEVCKHENYLGKRGVVIGKNKKRGLFSSSTKKLINSDINGALNIGRKYMQKIGKEISLEEIQKIKGILNPIKTRNLKKETYEV